VLLSQTASCVQTCQETVEVEFAEAEVGGEVDVVVWHGGEQNESKDSPAACYHAGMDGIPDQDINEGVGFLETSSSFRKRHA